MVCNMIPGTSSISVAPTALNLNFNAFPGLTAWATVVTRLRRYANLARVHRGSIQARRWFTGNRTTGRPVAAEVPSTVGATSR